MKTLYKKLIGATAAALFCAFLSAPVVAQHTGSSGGGGGSSSSSSHSSGGGGGGGSAPAARPSTGGGGSYSRPSGSGAYRPSGSPAAGARTSGAQRPTYVYRPGGIVRNTSPNAAGVRTGNYGYPQRTGVVGNGAYRTAPRVSSYWGTHGYYHFNHGYYTTYYLARLGYTCRILPYGYYPFFWSDSQYFFCDGLFYTYANDEYTVVEPPVGAEVTTLPDNAQSIVINGQQYYECNGVYYQPVTKDDGSTVYVVAGKDGVLNTDQSSVDNTQPQGPQLGDIVTQLPPDCRKLKINGDKLWVSPDGIYYKEIVDTSGNKTYKIVGLPDDQNGNGSNQGAPSTSGQ
jgi:hypothetical protein